MKAYTVYGVEKETGSKIVLGVYYSLEEARQFCERWKWNYDDGKSDYWMEIED